MVINIRLAPRGGIGSTMRILIEVGIEIHKFEMHTALKSVILLTM